jgi:hypothetical protein
VKDHQVLAVLTTGLRVEGHSNVGTVSVIAISLLAEALHLRNLCSGGPVESRLRPPKGVLGSEIIGAAKQSLLPLP